MPNINIHENNDYLTKQIITYLGNKRKLLSEIETIIIDIQKKLNQNKLNTCDIFSGSGVVARMMKKYSHTLHTNDLEKYSFIINDCYLKNNDDIDWSSYNKLYDKLNNLLSDNTNLINGIITDNYAPQNDNDIQFGERAFYTHNNAQIIDTINNFIINNVPDNLKSLFYGPLLYNASVHVNTSGVFKGFYKSKDTKIGKFGGDGENALDRIKGKIILEKPILSNFNTIHKNYQENANDLAKKLKNIDITYIDPPYNQHPYGSNYFMLNTIINNNIGDNISKVSGIPNIWNKSDYNTKSKALASFDDLIYNLDSKYIIISYNSEGFISYDEMMELLKKYGNTSVKEIVYPTFRGSRNLNNRNIHVNEYIFTLKKNLNN